MDDMFNRFNADSESADDKSKEVRSHIKQIIDNIDCNVSILHIDDCIVIVLKPV